MGCGCGKNRNNRIARKTAARKKQISERLASTSKARGAKLKRRRVIEIKVRFCRSCPHSIPTPDERRRKARVCHKASTSIQSILNQPDFKCPIGNF